jgi:hypothetical protein
VAVLRLDGERQLGEGPGESVSWIEVHTELVVALAKVLDEGVSRADDSC